MDREEALKVLQGKGAKPRSSRKVANNTRLSLDEDGTVRLRLHETDIMAWKPDGTLVLDSGGWRTNTTKERIDSNLPAPFRLFSEGGTWFLSRGFPWETPRPEMFIFQDGMKLKDGKVSGASLRNAKAEKETAKLKQKIAGFCREYMDAFEAGNVSAPSAGDCWFCLMFDQGGKPGSSADHLESHFEEKYYVPSLLNRALEAFPVSNAAKNWIAAFWDPNAPKDLAESAKRAWAGFARNQVEASLYRYLGRRFGLNLRFGARRRSV